MFDDCARRKREVRAHQLSQTGIFHFPGSEGVHHHRYGFGDSNRVGELNLATLGQARGDDVLGNVAGHVARRAVNFRRILAGECAAAVAAHAAVRIHDDFAASQTRIAVRSANHETARRIDMELGPGVHHARRAERGQ